MRKNDKQGKIFRIVVYIIVGVFYLSALIIYNICKWSKMTFGVGLDEIIFTLTSPLKGTETGVIENALRTCIPPVVVGMGIYFFWVLGDVWNSCRFVVKGNIFKLKFKIELVKNLRFCVMIGSVIALVFSLVYVDREYKVIDYIYECRHATTIYEDYYVDPENVDIIAPEDKRNLIYIVLESMETTYSSTNEGGAQPENYIPSLTDIANEGYSFSDKETLGGFHSVTGTGYTMGALLAFNSGVPFSFPVEGNSMDTRQEFASGLCCLGDILKQFGYNQEFLSGSDAEFAGKKTFFEQHGDYKIFDLYTAREKGYIPEDYKAWWGFEDKYLYEMAKDELLELAQKKEPFNFTMLTADPHHVGGYICEICPQQYENPTANVISCADSQIKDFIEWCKAQDFYENTTIVIVGDHPRMDQY